MAKLAEAGSRDPRIRQLASDLTTAGFWTGEGLQQKDYEGEARRLFKFVRDEIRYVKDPAGAELLHDPVTLLQRGAGDCDDKAILLAALLGSIGHVTRFKAVAFAPGDYSHVWLQDQLGGRWVDLEPTEPLPFGQAVPLEGAVSFMEYPVSMAYPPGPQQLGGLKKLIRKIGAPVAAVAAVAAGQPQLAVAAYQGVKAASAKKPKAPAILEPPIETPPPGLLPSLSLADRNVLLLGGAGLVALLLLRRR